MQLNKPNQSHDLQSSILITQLTSLRNIVELSPNQKERSEDVHINEEVSATKNKNLGENDDIDSRRYSQNTLANNHNETVEPNISINNSFIAPHANFPKSPTLPFS